MDYIPEGTWLMKKKTCSFKSYEVKIETKLSIKVGRNSDKELDYAIGAKKEKSYPRTDQEVKSSWFKEISWPNVIAGAIISTFFGIGVSLLVL